MSAVGGTPLVATPPTGFEAVGTPMLEVPKHANLPASARLYTLRFVDNFRWHYLMMTVLALDFFGNCIAVSFTSTSSFYKYGLHTRLGSSFCVITYALDMVLRLISVRSAIARSAYTLCDIFVFVLVFVALFMRFVFADNPSKLKVHTDGWTDSYHTNTQYRSNQIEIYLDTAYAFLIACRIILKPRAREFSRKLHNFAHNDHILIGIESVRAALRRVPRITAMAIELLDSELRMVCGRDDGDMSRKELLSFLERALQHRPRQMSADTFLGYLRDIDARSTSKHSAYGALDVVRSTFYHWSSQKFDLAMTILVVLVSASVLPILAYFLQICTDQGFPSSVWTYALHEFNEMGFDIGLSLHHEYKWKNQTTNDNGTLIDLPFLPWTKLITGVIGIIGISIPFAISDYAMGYFQSKMIANATKSMQDSLIRVILRQPTQFFSQRSDGDLNNLFQSDIARVNAMWQAVFWNLMNPITGIIVGFTYLMVQEPTIGAMSFAFSALIVTSGPQRLAAKKSQVFSSQSAYSAAEFQNAVACHKVVSAYGIQNPLATRFTTQTITPLRYTQFSKDFWSGVVQIYIESGMFAFVACMTVCLAIKVFHGDITSGQFFSSVTMLNRISSPVTILGGFMRVAIGNASSLQRLDDIIFDAAKDTENYEMDDRMKPPMPRMQECVTVQSLSFKYDDNHVKWILDDINCIFQKWLWQKFGYPDATPEECIEAARLAECDDFIHTLKDGYDTVIGQHAVVNLSGGQIQRICLARALVRKPSILLLDEATSALDPETEARIVSTLEKLAKQLEMTVISVTHRLSTARNADKILVMRAGRIIEEGTYKELLHAPRSVFAELVHKMEASIVQEQVVARVSRASLGSCKKLQHLNPDPVYDTHRALELFGSNLDARAAEARSRSENGSSLAALRRSLRKSSKQGDEFLIIHLFTNELSSNVAKAPINSAGLDALGYIPGRTATDLRMTTGISLANTSDTQILSVPFYKINTRSFCSGCGTSPELGFGHCDMTFVYNDTTKAVVITKSTNVLGSIYKVGIILPRSIFSAASYIKILAIIFAVGGFLASRKTVMWVEQDAAATESILAKIIHVVSPKSFNYPSHALRFDMFCFNSDVFVFLFTISVLLDMQNSFLFLRFMNLYNAQTPSLIHYLQMAGLTTRLLWLNCTCLKLTKIVWSFISTTSFNGDSKIMGFCNLTSVISLYLSAIMLIEVPAYIEYNNSLNYDLNNKVENLDAIHVSTFDSFYFRAVPALTVLMLLNIFFFTALDQLWNRKKFQILSRNSLGRQALYNSSSILCDFQHDVQSDTTNDAKETLLICKARRLSTLQWFFMSHLTCFGLQEKDLRNRKGKQMTHVSPGPSAKEDLNYGKYMVVQDGDRNVHLLDDQFVDVTSLVYNIKVLKDTNICIH
ncbi:ATP-binding Cassette (ABC) Superfamily [Thraustotheca clavata]|uniref:ATP-binding Cassette (ABC) Superfamily n=1 Tax=Thraustotheca clavata TaxID=74557 RepID=A0A1W0AB22_9STRA|nr:ATP-binding Cassette (ABC) Superfamily [Thraustotheca clavata]